MAQARKEEEDDEKNDWNGSCWDWKLDYTLAYLNVWSRVIRWF